MRTTASLGVSVTLTGGLQQTYRLRKEGIISDPDAPPHPGHLLKARFQEMQLEQNSLDPLGLGRGPEPQRSAGCGPFTA